MCYSGSVEFTLRSYPSDPPAFSLVGFFYPGGLRLCLLIGFPFSGLFTRVNVSLLRQPAFRAAKELDGRVQPRASHVNCFLFVQQASDKIIFVAILNLLH